MKLNKPKYKIVYQAKENVWGKYNNQKKFQSQKWTKLIHRLDKKNRFSSMRRPKSLKVLPKQRLLNKQKFASFYGNLTYTRLKNEYRQIKTTTSFYMMEKLIIALERRLDIFLFRSGIFSSIFQAKQFINHNKIKVNNKIVSNTNYKLKEGDFINYLNITNKKLTNQLPYAQIDKSLNVLIFLRNPKIYEIKYPFKINLPFLFNYLNKK